MTMTDGTADQISLRSPRNLAEVRTPLSVLEDIVLRRTMLDGKTSTTELSERIMLGHSLVDALVQELRDKRLVDVLGMESFDLRFQLTDMGRAEASRRYETCAYAGPAPVTLAEYTAVVQHQAPDLDVDRNLMQTAFGDLVVTAELLDQIGPALMSTGAIFLYGPPGTGKTSLAERMIRVHRDAILVPHTVEVDRQIVSLYDPAVHHRMEEQPEGLDPRWIMCHRPCVISGGELSPGMLDLTLDRSSGIYLAPLQMKANNGIFVIDDFGRQRMTPDELLNRWIVPLDRGIDFLSLSYGVKFTVPFQSKVVFSTNLEPSQLGDEAFFRRIHNKIYVGAISDEHFDWILTRVTSALKIPVTKEAAEHLRYICRTRGSGDLRPYLPIDVARILQSLCRYEGRPAEMTPFNLDRVADIYFAHGFADPTAPVAPPSSDPADTETTPSSF